MAKQPKAPKPKPVSVIKELREAHPWIGPLAKPAQDAAVAKRRKKERAAGPKLSEERLRELADELETIQRRINPDLARQEEIKKELLAHWGHTGISEIESSLGNTLISQSFSLGADPDVVKNAVGSRQWVGMTARILQPERLLTLAANDEALRETLKKAVVVSKLTLAVTPPSSRRAKSGQPSDEDRQEAA